jgi:hypothetical protein
VASLVAAVWCSGGWLLAVPTCGPAPLVPPLDALPSVTQVLQHLARLYSKTDLSFEVFLICPVFPAFARIAKLRTGRELTANHVSSNADVQCSLPIDSLQVIHGSGDTKVIVDISSQLIA